MNFSAADQEHKSAGYTGLRGTPNQAKAENETVGWGNWLGDFTRRATAAPDYLRNLGERMLPGGKYGMGENADNAVSIFGRDMFNSASGGGAMRGQMSPENTSGVIGSAITNALPSLIPAMQNFQMAQFAAPQSLFSLGKTTADYWARALGSQQTSEGSGNSFGVGLASMGGGTGSTT